MNEFEVNLEVHLSFTYSEYPFTNKYNEGGEKEDDPEDCNDLYVLKCGRFYLIIILLSSHHQCVLPFSLVTDDTKGRVVIPRNS